MDSATVGPVAELELSEAHIEIMRNIEVFEVSDILQKPPRDLSKFEEALLRGVHWFANAQAQQEPENTLLNLTTCLETFLTPEGGNPIKTTVAEGVAMILSDSLDGRRSVKSKIMTLYDNRSAISHGGRTAVLQRDLAYLTDIALGLLQTLIRRRDEFSSRKDLATWLEEQRLA